MITLTLTEATFDHELTRHAEPILVDFWAEGCGPCKALLPTLVDLAIEHAGRLRVGTVRLDDAPSLASRFEIMTLPTLIVFIDGRPRKRLMGAVNRDQLMRELRGILDLDGVTG